MKTKQPAHGLEYADLKSIHVFQAYNNFYLIHGDTSALFRITPIAYDYLHAIEHGLAEKSALRNLARNFSNSDIADLQSNLADLLGGLTQLTPPVQTSTDDLVEIFLSHHPRNIMLFITNKCNLQCSYCYERYPGRTFRPRHLSESETKQVLRDYFVRSGNRSPVTVTFFGGEPLLNFDVLKTAVTFCMEESERSGKEQYFCITTNATIMTDEMIDFLVQHRFGVMASIDGPPEFHDSCRKFPDGSGSYAVVARNIKRLLSRQLDEGVLPVKLRATMTRENYRHYDALSRYFRTEFPGARIMIGETTGTVEFTKEWDVPHADAEFQKHYFDTFHTEIFNTPLREAGILFREQLAALKNLHFKLHSPKTAPHLPQICGVCRNMMAVSSDGKYYPCHRFIGMDKFVMGNTVTGIIRDAVCKFYRELISTYQDRCIDCWARTLCGGDCPSFLATDNGTFRPPVKKRCESLKKAYELSISIYYNIKEKRPDIFSTCITSGTEQ